MPLPVTSALACILAIWIVILTWRVIGMRRKGGVVIGDGEDRALAKAIRGQANATEQIPIFLILTGLAEAGGSPAWALWTFGGIFVAGRLAHGAYFGWHGLTWRLRFYGMLATLTGQICMIAILGGTLLL